MEPDRMLGSKALWQSLMSSRAFAVSAPELWNKLLVDIRSCNNLSLFKDKLKISYISRAQV